jgi:hypothetical protein
MSCFNQWCFDPPARAIATAWADMGLSLFRMEEKLIAGTVLWRMGNSEAPYEVNATSPWWISQATFDYLCTTAARIAGDEHRLDRTFRRLARMKLAVLPSWGSRSDVVIRLSLKSRARVFFGRGRFVEDSKDNVHYRALGAFEIEQVFLPGLSWPGTNDPAAVAKAPRNPVRSWRDHAEVTLRSAMSHFTA